MSPLNRELIRDAIGIARVSYIDQLQNASIETQSEEIRIRAEKEGYNIVETLIDGANSAFHKVVTKRQAMNDLLEAALSKERNIEAIFFYEESRLSRQFYDFTLFIYDVIKREKPHMKFYSTMINGEWDPYNVLTVVNFATAANHSVTLSRRAKDAQKNVLAKQERPGSPTPYGYKLKYSVFPDENEKPRNEKGEQVIDNGPATIVLFIFYLASWGHSQRTIADLLNASEIPSPEGKKWSSGTIDYILDNDHYLGHLPWNIRSSRNTSRKKQRGEYDLIFHHHEPIINVPFWNITHQTIELHMQNGKNNNSNFFLRGILYCKTCDQALVSKNETPTNSKKSYLVYRCTACKRKLDMSDIHEVVLKEVSSKWHFTLTQMQDNIGKLMTKRKKRIEAHRNAIKQHLQDISVKEEFIIHSPDVINQDSEWDFILSVSKSKLSRELFKANSFLEHIDLVAEDLHSNQIFTLLKLTKLQSPEIRTLLLTILRRIEVDFANGTLLYIHYKLAPFTAIDQYVDSIEST